MQPLVSIIIPVYNAESFLAETIASALAQTWENKEIIIVDDGSTDHSLGIAQSFKSKNVHVFWQSNSGASAARNHGLRQSKGTFIQFLDADDLISTNKIEKQLKLIINEPEALSFCQQINFVKNPEFEKPVPLNVKHITCPFQLLLNLYGGYGEAAMIAVHAWLTPRELIVNAGEWNENLTLDDDGEFFCRVVLASQKALFCEEVYCYYRKCNPKSLSTQVSLKHFESELLSLDLKTTLMQNKVDSDEVRKAMSFWYLRIAILAYPKYRSISTTACSRIRQLKATPDTPVMGGKIIETIKKIMGWKFARILQAIYST